MKAHKLRRKRHVLLIGLQACGVVIFGVGLLHAEPSWDVFQLTSGPDPDFIPAVDGTTYVWQRGTGSNVRVMMWTEGDAKPVQISTTTKDFAPRIDDARVVWESNASGGDYEVKLWESGLETTLTSNTNDDRVPDIGGVATVWRVNTWYLLYDNGLDQFEITADAGTADEYPRVMNDWLVWEAGSPRNIYFWNDGNLAQTTNTAYSNVRPETDGAAIVWYTVGEPGELSNVMRWTEALGTVVLTNDGASIQPDVSGDVVVFARHDGNDYEVYFRYFGADYQITNNDFDDLEPAVAGNRVVWASSDGSDRFVYYAVLSGLDGGEVAGACCVNLDCVIATPTSCASKNGAFLGTESLCSIDSCGIEPAGGWSTFQHDAQRTGRTDALTPEQPVRIWSLFVGQPVTPISPTIGSDGTIHVAGEEDLILAVRPNGTLKWLRDLHGESAFASATIRRDGHLYLPKHSQLAKLFTSNGETSCAVSSDTRFAAALDAAGQCYFASGNSGDNPWSLRKMAPDCSVEWTFNDSDGGVLSHVAIGLDGAIHASSGFKLITLNPINGTEAWRIPTAANPGAPAIGPDGTIHFYISPNSMYAANPDGTEKWSITIPTLDEVQPVPSPALGLDGTIYQPSVTSGPAMSALVAVSASGSVLWTVTEPGFDSLSPAIDGNGTIVFPVRGGDMLGLSAVDGAELWRISFEGSDYVNTSPAIAEDGTIYVTTADGWLIAYGVGCPEISSPPPPFSYRKVVEIGETIEGLEIDEIVDFELDNVGLVTFEAMVGNDTASFMERADSGFDVIAQGSMIGGFEIDSVSLPRKNDQGDVYMNATVVDVGPAIFVNDGLYVAERELADPPVLLESIYEWWYVDHDESGRFLMVGRQFATDPPKLLSVDPSKGSVTVLLSVTDVIDGFIVDEMNPESVDGYANDGIPVLQVYNGQFAIVTPSSVVARTGDVIDGRPITNVRAPRRNSGGTIYYIGDRDVFSHTPEGVDSFERGFGDRAARHPVLEIETYSINEFNDIAYFATLLGSQGVFIGDEPAAIDSVTKIDGTTVELGSGQSDLVSLNDDRQIAFVANGALYVATLLVFDTDHDGDVDGDDLGVVASCFESAGAPDCGCLASADSNRDLAVDCLDWDELKRTWTGPPMFPPLRLECDMDCNGNNIADDVEVTFGTTSDCDGNSRPDSCDLEDEPNLDSDGDGMIDSCCRPITPIPDSRGKKNRFLSFEAAEDLRQAFRISFESLPPPFDLFDGQSMWVGQPREVSENGASVEPIPGFPNFLAATLTCDPYYAVWSPSDTIHVFHETIVPNGVYSIQVINEGCGIAEETNYSLPLEAPTAAWGDTLKDFTTDPPGPPDGAVNIVDALGVIGRFVSQEGAIVKARADLEPGCLDLSINITDVLSAITGLQGLDYPFEPSSPDPCNSTCINPLP